MNHLSLVKSLSHLKEAQKYSDEILLASVGLTLTRGAIAEIAGEASSGKTSLMLAVLAELTAKGEICRGCRLGKQL